MVPGEVWRYIVARVRERAALEGGQPDVIEAIYRAMMETYIAYEHREPRRPAPRCRLRWPTKAC